ncbi:hypothetical protein [Bowmanella pacifica]|uniref:Uncharacterized protein n=1 Tax=Bowmanella pacifica TaxID=502051 RepID=A0A918DGT5_9ALTE|nr:hypothetical protein [Bowmanella pacifica]GGO65340.1 hypothetical protein GCM10010982_06920 [Bowmanella pacifica]
MKIIKTQTEASKVFIGITCHNHDLIYKATRLYVSKVWTLYEGYDSFKSICEAKLPRLSYKTIFDYAKAGEITLNTAGPKMLGKYSNSSMLQMRKLDKEAQKRVWKRLQDKLGNKLTQNTASLTASIVSDAMLNEGFYKEKLSRDSNKFKYIKTLIMHITDKDMRKAANCFKELLADERMLQDFVLELTSTKAASLQGQKAKPTSHKKARSGKQPLNRKQTFDKGEKA